MNIKFIELFAGIGGFRHGLETANRKKNRKGKENSQRTQKKDRKRLESEKRKRVSNKTGRDNEFSNSKSNKGTFTCVYSNEWNKYASEIYKRHYGECDTRDIREVSADEIPEHDLLTAGFPCQAFSIAGRRKGFEDTRGTLFFEIARILQQKQPSFLLLENVKGLLSHKSGQTFETILRTLDELGYDLQWQVLNSKDFNVPQNRERVFIVGHLRGISRPEIFPIIRDRGKNPEELTIGMNQANRAYNINGSSPTIPTSGGGRHEPKIGIFVYKDDTYKTKISNTIDSNYYKGITNRQNRTGVIDNMKVRKLTPTECERLQGFPDGWTEGISDTQRYKCLGNAVTTTVITEIGLRFLS